MSSGSSTLSNDLQGMPLGVSGFHFADLYSATRLKDLHEEFWKFAETSQKGLRDRFYTSDALTPPQQSEILIEVAKVVGEYIAKLFQITSHAKSFRQSSADIQPIFRMKRDFLNIRVFKRFTEAASDNESFQKLEDTVNRILANEPPRSGVDQELRFAEVVLFLVDCEKKLKTQPLESNEQVRVQHLCSFAAGSVGERISTALATIEEWCVQVYVDPVRRKKIAGWASFVRPNKLDFDHLVAMETPETELPEKKQGPTHDLRFRDGFKLTDLRMTPKEVMREIDYCIYCHQREKDSCAHGFPEKPADKTGDKAGERPAEKYKKNPLGIPLTGCPLDEKISEMHLLRKQGEVIAALATIMLDNPMCPGTGHRICNDCMKGCIFQKQEPVNIPQNETAVLTDVLNMPYGFEIYSLLTRFNPLHRKRPYALPYNGVDVLVVGLGPAGYTLTHYLANEGFGVVGIDALKLEPIDPFLTGKGKPFPKPVANFSELKKELDDRVLTGFGGVSEYGITVRWDKNFLNVIYLSLLRRSNVRFFGGVRFGGTVNLEDAWELGFEHVALATGAGKPTIIDLKNNLIRGIRKASDFLMALQLTGAFKKASMANLQVKLPAIVIGGGLTAVDTATELLAYYPGQVEKTLERFETLSREFGEDKVWEMCDAEEKETLTTFLEHGRAVKEERRLAEKERRKPNFIQLIRRWGGVSLAYRKKITDSPAYRLNHEEVAKAFEEGIYIIENMTPLEANRDKYGAVESLRFKRGNGEEITLPAKSVMVAAGTSPNTIYEREFPGTFKFDAKKNFFQSHRIETTAAGKRKLIVAKPGERGFFLSLENKGKFVSYYGDNHPEYAGNVVKAMASAKHGFEEVKKLFLPEIEQAEKGGVSAKKYEELTALLDTRLVPRVVKVNRLTPTIVEVIVKGYYVSKKFEPGQFFRLQNYETASTAVDGTRLQMEGLALTGAYVEKDKDLLSMIVLEMGGSSRLVSALHPGDPVVVMGPTGTASETPGKETVLLVGGGLGNAVLLSIGEALRKNGSKVLYVAGYRRKEDVFYPEKIEAVTDQLIWAVDRGEPIPSNRPQDISFVGNIVQAMLSYAKGDLGGKPKFPLNKIDRIICIGSDRMMRAVTEARHGVLKPFLKEKHVGIGSINSPMQCMMKEVCAQCLQRHVDPKTGKEFFVFSCFNQDQELDTVDWNNLNDRLKGNSLLEKMSNRYLDYLFEKGKLERI